MARRSNGTRTGRSIRTPTTISPRSASCSTTATCENGPMMVMPGSHHGPIYDHHGPTAGSAARSTRPPAASICRAAVPCLGKAGSITVHHVRAVHGSATNFSGKRAPLPAVPIPRRRCLAAARLRRRHREVRRAAAGRRADPGAAPRAGAGAAAAAAGRASGLDLREPARHRPALFRTAADSARAVAAE